MSDMPPSIEMPDLPATLALTARRYGGPKDLPGIVDVLHAARRADGVDWLPSLEDMRNEFEHLVNEVPQRDMIVVERDDRIVAWVRSAWALRDEGYVYRTSGEVHPDLRRRGVGRALLRTAQRHLRDIAADHPRGGDRRFGAEAIDGERGAKALLAAEGYAPIRFFAEMRRPLDEPIPTHALPAGIEFRPVREADHRQIFDAEAEAFRDHWGSREWTDVDFRRTFTSPELDTSLWRVAWRGDEVVGVTETFIHAEENAALKLQHGWLERISTRRPWRAHGVAKAMIASAMVALRDKGMTHAALGVDADNPSGAFGLYESLGFRVANRTEVLAKPFDD